MVFRQLKTRKLVAILYKNFRTFDFFLLHSRLHPGRRAPRGTRARGTCRAQIISKSPISHCFQIDFGSATVSGMVVLRSRINVAQ